MSSLTTKELEDIKHDETVKFDTIPLSHKTIQVWKRAYELADKRKYTDAQILKLIVSDPSANYFDEKEIQNKKIIDYEDNQPSDFVKINMIKNGIQLDDWMTIPVGAKEYDTDEA